MAISQSLHPYILPIARSILQLAFWFLLPMIVFVPLERLFCLHPQSILRKSFPIDAAYYLLNGILPKFLLAAPMAAIAWTLHHVVPGRVHLWVAAMPIWARLVAALAVGDFGFYWGHRWMHQIPFLWRFHAIHHSAEEMDWLVNVRAHPLDLVFGRLCGFVPMYALGLVQPIRGNTLDVVPLAITLAGTFWGYFIHSNLRCRLEWLGAIVSTPAFHHWHHTNDEHINRNYAAMLPFLDRLFGTWYVPKEWPSTYGIDTPVGAGLPAQLMEPLLARGQQLHAEIDAASVEIAR